MKKKLKGLDKRNIKYLNREAMRLNTIKFLKKLGREIHDESKTNRQHRGPFITR